MNNKFSLVPTIIVVFTFAFSFLYLFAPPLAPYSPVGLEFKTYTQNVVAKYQVLGFLPYWNIKKFTPQASSSLTDLAYFTLRLDGSGNIVTNNNPREEEPGYTNYKRLIKAGSLCAASPNISSLSPCPNLTLTFAQLDQDALVSLLSYPSSRNRAISTITSLVKESDAKGVNIDFEPLGTTSRTMSNNLTLFSKDLYSNLSPLGVTLSISVYPSAASRPRIWDLAALEPYMDQFVVMAYDYTLPGDVKTGPNSPLRGAGTLFEHDILTNLADFVKIIPPRKILLGIPFYGYEWQVDDEAKYTPTEGRGATASLERIQELLDKQTLELIWDRNSLTPYAVRREDGEVVSQIYFEDVNSIKLKLDLVKSAGLGGIAIWAIGYEGEDSPVWSTITSELRIE